MTTSLIVIADQEFGIGHQGAIPWKFPAYEEYFKQLVKNHPVIMGRKTFESRGLIEDVANMLVSQNTDTGEVNTYCSVDLFDAIERCKWKHGGEEIFIVGGAELFESALVSGVVDKIYLTHISRKSYDCDVFFQDSYLKESFKELYRTVRYADNANPERLEFVIYNKRKPDELRDQKKTQ